MKIYPAIAALEFDDIAAGVAATDAMLKRAPIAFFKSGTITHGRYLTLIGGTTAYDGNFAALNAIMAEWASNKSYAQRVADIECPILALQAGDDANITAEDNAAFARALTAADVEHEVVTYDGAPHSFFDRKQEEFADASADAWRRTQQFIAQHA